MNIESLKLSVNSSIEKALEIIGKERVRLGVVVGKKGEFLGIISDSNIRKALINGKTLKSNIKEIYTKNPITIAENTSKQKLLELSAKTDIYDFPVLNKKGEVVSIRSISSLLSTKKLPFYVILMAGGLGSRLKELTKETPKPMLKVGKKPILENIIQRLHAQGFEKFIFCVNYKRQIIEDYFKKGAEFDVSISYVKERKKLGTAGALSLIKHKMEQSFVVMNADILTELDFNELLKAHQKSGALMSVCVREFHQQVPYGVIKQKNGFITHIEEKPMQSFLVSAGIYVCEPQILELLAKNTYLDMPELIEKVMQKGRVNTFLIEDYWIDIGRLEEFKRANDEIKE
ncbi:nucleotidyltransferase family protein [Campylobacter vulpis]|uniref:CBS domain-containing protein n=1 Tax=Campylobacter vulpis TaxID=1655500 RepID=A0ABS5P2L6_9BACT|nr:nucleotidyltransferase family protein [Campylobacter vulpis]MBS4240922.1 CBS domain-containing protein [Campylobacter vulpis]MBS4276018.1 CBS domain-containing protein [Campylobacter vulpis]MBS4281838.1 CBS domain-containing protein [Campylobacter vulpis]MBS4307414.1 CBS domain-containing protein [Campylobacter vulpis]MBS4330302.1 CBS domain-containing protein [Campylobacter vulpis]